MEIVKFRIADGVSEAQFRDALDGMATFIGNLKGFINRRTVIGEDGDCYDLVQWETMAAAKAAQEAFSPETYPELGTFMACLDMSDGSMNHGRIIHSSAR